jgi:hypothetical protein
MIFILTSALAVVLMSTDVPWKHAAAEVIPDTPSVTTTPSASVSTTSMEEPLRLIGEARKAFATVRDYRCTLIKQERIDGQLTPETVMQLEARTEPYSVHLRWQEPSALRGQEACYVEGKNNGKLRARAAGALGLIGFVSLDPDSPRARGASKYSITEAGLGYLIESFATGWEMEHRVGKTQVKIDLGEVAGHACIRVETIHPVKLEGLLFARSVVWFDQLTSLPVRVENFDWPHGEEPGELAEVFNFVDIQTNVGLPDNVFQH